MLKKSAICEDVVALSAFFPRDRPVPLNLKFIIENMDYLDARWPMHFEILVSVISGKN